MGKQIYNSFSLSDMSLTQQELTGQLGDVQQHSWLQFFPVHELSKKQNTCLGRMWAWPVRLKSYEVVENKDILSEKWKTSGGLL